MAEVEQLMSELAWLTRLARALLRDASDADDLVQDTWLVAAEHAPRDGRPVKPWLHRVALNLVRMRSRGARRRAAREAAVEAASAPTPDELVGRVEAQRIVVDEVLRLAEPYRSTLLLHYFEELSSAEIARRLGIPDGTVRRRLKAGLDELRGRLRAGERATGRAVLAALAPVAIGRSASTALGMVAMKKIVAIVVVIVGLIVAASRLHRTEAPAAVAVAAPGSAAAPAAPGAPRAPVTAHVMVTVTDAAGPVAGATIRCAPADGEVVLAQAGADGTAVLELAAGSWSVAASADGHEPGAAKADVVAGHDAQVAIALRTGGRTLSGTVTDVTGGAVVGARIDAARLDGNARLGRAVAVAFTDREGRYKLTTGAGQLLVAASHPEYAPQTRYVDLGAAGATASFALVPGGAIEGVVRDAQTKQPVPGAIVRVRQGGSALELAEASERTVTGDGDGAFRITGLRPGTYDLSAREGGRATRAPLRVGLGVAEQQADVVLLVGATAAIRGTVVDEAGGAAAGVTVTARDDGGEGGSTTSDAAGRFVLEGLAPSRWRLRGTSERYLSAATAPVELKARDVDGVVVRVRRGLELRGHVEPRAECDVVLSNEHEGQGAVVDHRTAVTTGADGSFHFRPVGAGAATLAARCANGDAGSVEIVAAAGMPEQIVRVTPGGAIAGKVVDASGAPLVGFGVTAEALQDNTAMTTVANGAVTSGFQAVTTAGGAFEIRGLTAARYALTALDRGRPVKAKKSVELAISDGQRVTGVELVVERPRGTIRGTVTGPDGTPVADAWVTVRQTLRDQLEAMSRDDAATKRSRSVLMENQGSPDALPPALTDAHGRFELTSVPPGRYQLAAEAKSGKLRGHAADVAPDAEVAIQLAGVSSLHGTVRGPHGASELFSVELAGPTSDTRSFTDGAFEFSRVDPGDYKIDVQSSEGTAKGTVHVAPGEDATVELTLLGKARVTGRLVDKTGAPLAGVPVMIVPEQPADQMTLRLREPPPTTGPDGRFTAESEPGKRMLVVMNATMTIQHGLVVEPGKPLDVGDVIVDGRR